MNVEYGTIFNMIPVSWGGCLYWRASLQFVCTGLQYALLHNQISQNNFTVNQTYQAYTVTEYRLFYGTIVMYDYNIFSLGLDSISLNVQRT